ncbi:hypothetical protein [Kitasatospora sp. NPDC018619]|uniref:hypothetical protein n=1 Tax=unclassified Kitasatospora TaxID=2633591 RepID=UPI0037BE0268
MSYELCGPGVADWCITVIGGRPGETDYWIQYVKGDRPESEDACLFLPGGWELLEFECKATPHGAHADEWEPEHTDYPHEPGSLYDCPACEYLEEVA